MRPRLQSLGRQPGAAESKTVEKLLGSREQSLKYDPELPIATGADADFFAKFIHLFATDEG